MAKTPPKGSGGYKQSSHGVRDAQSGNSAATKTTSGSSLQSTAQNCGWQEKHVNNSYTKSYVQPSTGNRIDYYPTTDRAKTTLQSHPKDSYGIPRGNAYNKDIVRDNVGGSAGVERLMSNVRTHTGTGRYHKSGSGKSGSGYRGGVYN